MAENNEHQKARKKFRDRLDNAWVFRFFLFTKMPIALLAGLYVRRFDEKGATVSVPFKWLSQNPFKSVYFATQAMAAEMSTGLPAMAAIQGYHPGISMLVTNIEAEFVKKANQRVYFSCDDGDLLTKHVSETVAAGEGRVIKIKSVGRLKDGTIVSTFHVTWSFKQKQR